MFVVDAGGDGPFRFAKTPRSRVENLRQVAALDHLGDRWSQLAPGGSTADAGETMTTTTDDGPSFLKSLLLATLTIALSTMALGTLWLRSTGG